MDISKQSEIRVIVFLAMGVPHMKFLTSDMHGAEAVILKLHVKLAPGWALIQVNSTGNWAQSRGWVLFHKTTVKRVG